jgi:Fic family protein
LIERGIDEALIPHDESGQDPARTAAMIRDHESAIDGLFVFVKGERPLSTSYIKELHAQLTRNQETATAIDAEGRLRERPLLRGEYKKLPNNPQRADGAVHEYCPPEQVASEMERLIELHLSHGGLSPETEAAWLHHRFTQIHPFQDGNGRVARCLATLVFIRSRWFPLVVRDVIDERRRYLDALEEADRGSLLALIRVFAEAQKKSIVQALGASAQVLDEKKAERVIEAAAREMAERASVRREEWSKAKEVAQRLQSVASDRLKSIVGKLESETEGLIARGDFFHDESRPGDARDRYFRWQIIETAKQLDYFANTTEYRAWSRLVLLDGSQAEILVSFHAAGRQFRGIIMATACFFRREHIEEREREIRDLTPLSSELFQINYREPPESAEQRFVSWLENALVKGLEIWRRGL